MSWLRAFLVVLLMLAGSALADEWVQICHGYGCLVQADIRYGELQLDSIRRMMFSAVDAPSEREMLASAVGLFYRWGAQQSPIGNDKGGNYADAGMQGRMDCIDHSTSTTRLLKMLAGRGYLRWHRVLEPDVRYFLGLIPAHWSAVIEETAGNADARYVVDSWFVDNGEPAVILPLEDWKKGAGPDV